MSKEQQKLLSLTNKFIFYLLILQYLFKFYIINVFKKDALSPINCSMYLVQTSLKWKQLTNVKETRKGYELLLHEPLTQFMQIQQMEM
ncbi:unnamed protein product [Paramecium octaurelia]|uniref:Uncharacterized protein n=1 Tax=Paramecium octaurelia TaxID=43137 RepID=A0A8S1YC32_PAROT|nr:unnamed protein product [Paramecium octaurelia]